MLHDSRMEMNWFGLVQAIFVSAILNRFLSGRLTVCKPSHDEMKNAPKIPEALKFPVPLDLFLRCTAGGKYKGDRLKKYRKFLTENMQFHSFMLEGRLQGKKLPEMPKPSLVQVSEVVAKHRAEGFRNAFEFGLSA